MREITSKRTALKQELLALHRIFLHMSFRRFNIGIAISVAVGALGVLAACALLYFDGLMHTRDDYFGLGKTFGILGISLGISIGIWGALKSDWYTTLKEILPKWFYLLVTIYLPPLGQAFWGHLLLGNIATALVLSKFVNADRLEGNGWIIFVLFCYRIWACLATMASSTYSRSMILWRVLAFLIAGVNFLVGGFYFIAFMKLAGNA